MRNKPQTCSMKFTVLYYVYITYTPKGASIIDYKTIYTFVLGQIGQYIHVISLMATAIIYGQQITRLTITIA